MTATLQEFLITRYEEEIRFLHDTFTSAVERQLNRVIALRRLVELHKPGIYENIHECAYCGFEGQDMDCTYPCDTLRLLGEEFQEHPDFDQSWLPLYPCPDNCSRYTPAWSHWWGFHEPNLLTELGIQQTKGPDHVA